MRNKRNQSKGRSDRGQSKSKPRTRTEISEVQDNALVRLNKFIANAGVCSRRDADKLIEAGEIKVNGKVVTELGTKVSKTDKVSYKGRSLKPEKLVYVLLNKPKDFITTTDDPENRRTVMELVKNATEERLYPVGRLDRNTTGLLLFTNDGELAEKLAHPSNEIKKIYRVEIDRPIDEADFNTIESGFTLEDGEVKVDKVAVVDQKGFVIGLEIHIGRNRIVRRVFEHLGYEVLKLDRVMYAGLDKLNLPRGKWRFLTDREVTRLKR
ncbi:rRNA pseudouridine synthase [Fulvivirga sp. RKSG066]|uniref:pseudouridine synthase n=1 Tax=Fulvivirga aurantia TaxID=2529383 RepID=UPI0012BBB056|nr:pseudouridine synthase [Fulvivirga aurantia]MTI20629.1 rRNA pseudouridine synthase [Fulvivirga aurantia]